MKTYFSLQWKRVAKVLPIVLLITIVLFVGIATVMTGMLKAGETDKKNIKLRIGVTGDTDSVILQLAMSAFKNLDESRYTVLFVEMTEEEAIQRLDEGTISAYLILPEDFVEKAMSGVMEPMYYVTTTGANDVVTMFKNELTTLITDVVVSSQKGSFGLEEALYDNNIVDESGLVDALAMKYAAAILRRAEVIALQELSIVNDVTTGDMYLCSLTVLFLMLLGLPFVVVYARRDRALNVLLLSRGVSNVRQLFNEWLPHFLSLVCLAAVVFVPVLTMTGTTDNKVMLLLTSEEWLRFVMLFVPVLAMASAFNLFVFELGGNIVSATLLHFFSTLCMCYVSGCFYPVYTFPRVIQAIEQFMPSGMARDTLLMAVSTEAHWYPLLGVAIYAVLFFVGALLIRSHKVRRWEGM